MFPLFFWLPASYHTPPSPVSALFAGLLTKVGVYALIRVFTLLFVRRRGSTHALLLVVAGLTMVVGVLGRIAQDEFRRVLVVPHRQPDRLHDHRPGARHAAGAGRRGLLLLHHIVVKANLFLIAAPCAGRRLVRPRRSGGLHAERRCSLLFLIPALSLAGVPPLSGFWAKLLVIKASLDAGHVTLQSCPRRGLLTLYSMTKIWNEAFWKAAPDTSGGTRRRQWQASPATRAAMLLPIGALAMITLTIGIAAEPFVEFSIRAANQVLDPHAYVQAVLGEAPAPAASPNLMKEIAP